MRKSITFLAVLSGATILASACGDDGGSEAACSSADTYVDYGMQFFATNCNLCHGAAAATVGGNLRLDSQAAIQQHSHHIIAHAVDLMEPIMPMGTQGLPKDQRDRLKAWLDCGAP